MEFRLTETLSPTAADRVLSALERNLGAIALMADLHEGVVTSFGIGPVNSCLNPSDVAVFEVFQEPRCTVVRAVVHYDEEYLPAGKARQLDDTPVEKKIAGVLARVRTELKLVQLESTAIERRTEQPLVEPPGEVCDSVRAAAGNQQAILRLDPLRGPALPGPVPDSSPAQVLGRRMGVPLAVRSAFPPFASLSCLRLRSIAALVVLGAGAATLGALLGRDRQVSPRMASNARVPSPAGQIAPTPVLPVPFPYTRRPAARLAEADLTRWVKAWADALRSRDLQAQASFYSNNVLTDLGEGAVDGDYIARYRKAALRRRPPLWTLRVEDVRIQSQSPSEAKLTLRMDTIEKTPEKGVTESIVNTRLTLHRFAGTWKIVEEKDQRPVLIHPELGGVNVAASVRQTLGPADPASTP